MLPTLPCEPFSTRGLSALLGCNMVLAQRTAYCLRMIKIGESAGERSHSPLHRRTPRKRAPLDREGRVQSPARLAER